MRFLKTDDDFDFILNNQNETVFYKGGFISVSVKRNQEIEIYDVQKDKVNLGIGSKYSANVYKFKKSWPFIELNYNLGKSKPN